MAAVSTTLDNIVAHWKLDSSDGGVTADASGNGYTLTNNNTVGSATGKQGNGVDCTPNDNLSITEQAAFRYTGSNNLSCSFWFKTDSVAAGTIGIVGMYNGTATGEEWLVYRNGANLEVAIRGSGTTFTSTAISTGTWYHVVLTMDSSNAYKLYVNGAAPKTASGATGSSNDTLEFRIGAYGKTATGFFDGIIDEVTLTSDIITSGEVATLYNSGNGIPWTEAAGSTFTPRVSFIM